MAKPIAFVIMPFTKAESSANRYSTMGEVELNTVFELVQEAFAESHLVKRADSRANIIRDIILDLDRSDLVIADLTGLNPNVMYELGIRHGFCRKTILITQDRQEIPFDLRDFYSIQYNWKTNKDRRLFIEELRSTLSRIEADPNPIHGPVHSHLGIKTIGLSEYERRKVIRQTHALVLELFWLTSAVDIGIYIALHGKRPNGADRSDLQLDALEKMPERKKAEVFSKLHMPSTLPCIELFLSENYIPEAFNTHREVDRFRDVLRVLQNIKLVTHTIEDLARVLKQAIHLGLMLYKAVKHDLSDQKIFVKPSDFIDYIGKDFEDFNDAPGIETIGSLQTKNATKKTRTKKPSQPTAMSAK